MNTMSDVGGFSDAQYVKILECFSELESPCAEFRMATLVSRLGRGLQSYMGIDQEILSQTFLAEYQRKSKLALP